MQVDEKSNEITHAPKLLASLDLRGVVVSGDAMFDRRSLSSKIVQAHGDYLWTVYLDFTLVDPSTTFNTKLPPVQAHSVYHPHVKARPFGCSASLRSLDMGWCVEPGPHREGTRSRRCGRRLTRTHRGRLTFGRKGTWGPLQRLRLTCFLLELIIRFRQGHLELLLKLL